MNPEFAKAFAVTFADKYINEGVAQAATLLHINKINEETAKELAPYIRDEFERRGYEFD